MSTNFQNQDSPFSASGRFGRLSFLAWNMLAFVIAMVIGIFIGVISAFISPELFSGTADGNLPIPLIIILVVFYIILIYISFIFIIRRLHDLNKSGWLSLVLLVPIISFFFVLYVIFAPGTEGHNDFGAPRTTQGWEKVLGWMYGLVPILGILAAISIPSYQSYVERAKLQQIEQQINQSE